MQNLTVLEAATVYSPKATNRMNNQGYTARGQSTNKLGGRINMTAGWSGSSPPADMSNILGKFAD